MKKSVVFELKVATVRRWLASRWFWRLTLLLFSLQATYVALVGRFSMAYDEYYHLASIQEYSKVWLPWSVQQPSGPANFGAVIADPSYLYHYLMSFPYRVLSNITDSLQAQVITLRLIDVAIVVIGLYVFRRLLLRLGMSRFAALSLLFFVTLLPMTPFLAGQLTYDTLWFTMSALTVLAMVSLTSDVTQRRRLPLAKSLATLSLLLITSQIKYAFLPMGVAGGIFLLVLIITRLNNGALSLRQILPEWRAVVRTPIVVAAIALLLVSSVLFVARYGGNTLAYHNPVPTCDAVLGRDRCLAYGPFARDDTNRSLSSNYQLTYAQKILYPFNWSTQMMRESYFAVGPLEAGYPTGKPLHISYFAGYIVVLASLVVFVSRARYVWGKGPNERLLVSIILAYVVVLFVNNYHTFLTTGAPSAIHGRYMLALLPLIGYLVYVAARAAPNWMRLRRFGIVVITVLLVATIYGGGIAPFIIRSSDGWYWSSAVPTSKVVRSVLWPITIR